MCEYCREKEGHISGKAVNTFEWRETAGYKPQSCTYLEMFILKGKTDRKAGLMINNGDGARYIDINYCPICGRKLNK